MPTQSNNSWEEKFNEKFVFKRGKSEKEFLAESKSNWSEEQLVKNLKYFIQSELDLRTKEIIDEIPDRYSESGIKDEYTKLNVLKQQLRQKYGIN